MSKGRKPKVEFRRYQMPPDCPVLALLGEKWIQVYGRDIDYLHFHNYLEVGYCYSGAGTMILGEQEYRFGEEECFTVIPANYLHTTNSDPGRSCKWEYLFIDVEGLFGKISQAGRYDKKERVIQEINSRAVLQKAGDYPEVARMIRNIMEIMRQKKAYYVEEAKGMLTVLLLNVARENRNWDGAGAEPQGCIAAPVGRAMDYIELHYMEQIKTEDLAGWCHISEAHLRRLFSFYLKMSPLEYINLVRIQKACDYLKTTDEQVADIAYKCGFPTLSTFNRNFKKIQGTSPNKWRKNPENYEQQLFRFEIQFEEGW